MLADQTAHVGAGVLHPPAVPSAAPRPGLPRLDGETAETALRSATRSGRSVRASTPADARDYLFFGAI